LSASESLLVDALQPHVARGLALLRGESHLTLDDLLGRTGAYYPSFDTSMGLWEFEFHVEGKVASFLAHECSRLGTASFQSYSAVHADLREPDLIPWALVRAYYSAFYAGHAILRLLGCSCNYIDGPRVAVLRKVLKIYSSSQDFAGGLYSSEMTPSGTSLILKAVGSGQGGTHDAFWKLFVARLLTLESDVLAGSLPRTDAQHVYLILGRLRAVLTRERKDGGWLSALRNAVQYRQAMDVWYPGCRVAARERTSLSRIAAGWLRDPLSVELPDGAGDDLIAFVSASAFLVASCRALLVRLGELGRLGRKQSFAYYGPLRFLRTNHLLGQSA
jgi:hypothetical protein